jgi:hypothetical protein
MRLSALGAFTLALSIGSAASAANLVTNGSFSATSLTPTQIANLATNNYSGVEFGAGQGYVYGNVVSGWQSNGGSAFNLWFFGDGSEKTKDADTFFSLPHGEAGQRPNSNYTGTSPNGGAFVVLDGDPGFNGALTQTVNGLTVGKQYDLSFYWSGGELADRKGYVSDRLDVNFGGDGQTTGDFFNSHPFTNNPSNLDGDFEGWTKVDMIFTAHSASQVLSFLSVGTPAANLPPVAFLDGVTLTSVPEPAVWGLMLVGFAGLGAALRRRRALAAAA